MGIGQGLQPVASFNYEAEKYNRVKKALLITTGIGFAVVFTICVPVYIWAEDVIRIFQKADAVIEFGTPALRYAVVGVLLLPIFTPINMVYQSIQKLGYLPSCHCCVRG